VVGGHGRHVVVEDAAGVRRVAHLRGKGKKGTAVVGDRVRAAPAGDEAVVESILARRNLLFRQDETRVKAFAANLDGLLVVVAAEPAFSESQLARALVAANDAGIPTTLVLNKRDLASFDTARTRLAPVPRDGRQRRRDEPEARDRRRARGAAAHARGPPDAGPRAERRGQEHAGQRPRARRRRDDGRDLGGARERAAHDDDDALYWIDPGRTSALIDSPGFQTFGLAHIAVDRLPVLMPDIGTHAKTCRFYNCSHVHEPGCGVRGAVEGGAIAPSRYRIYLELVDELGTSRD
jgi:ribosome biogenesis GTPase